MFEILELIKKCYPPEEADEIIKAYYFAKKAHEGQKRASGEEYFIHPCCVSKILIDLGLDYKTICAAFLHSRRSIPSGSSRFLHSSTFGG